MSLRRGSRVLAVLPSSSAHGLSIPPSTGGPRGGAGTPQPPTPTLTLTSIEALTPGAEALSHDGHRHAILHIAHAPHRGPLIGIRTQHSHHTLWLTPRHHVLCQRRTLSYGAARSWDHIRSGHFHRAREFRQQMTPAERLLWRALRGRQLGAKFRRQHPVGPYIADFFSREAGIVVEVDGESHYTPEGEAHDEKRDAYLTGLGLTVLHFINPEITRQLEGVLEAVAEAIDEARPSEDHSRQWRRARSLGRGDVVYVGAAQRPVPLAAVLRAEVQEDVFDLEIEGARSFLTEVCAVHDGSDMRSAR